MSFSEQMLQDLDEQDLTAAQRDFAQALVQDDDETLFSLAEELQALGFDQEAAQIARQLIKKYPDADEARLILAEVAIDDDQTDQALTWLNQISPDSPVYPQSLVTAADLYQTLNLLEVSEQKLLTAKRLLPDEPALDFGLGELSASMGRYQEATSYYQQLLAAGHDYWAQVSIKQRLAEALSGSGEYEQALAILEELTKNLATDDQLFQLGVLYHNLHQEEQAVATLTRLQQQNADYSALYEPLVASEQALDQLEAALQTAQVGLGYDEFNLNLYRLGAEAALALGKTTVAQQLLEQGLRVDPDAQALRLLLATVKGQQGDDQAVVELLEPIATAEQADPQVNWQLAVAYDHLDQVPAAKDAFFAAYPNLKTNPDFMRQFIALLQAEAQIPALRQALKQYLSLVPDDADYTALLLELENDDH
ncbi:tetratricopeptide repeat protein [Lapidilactobacillus luobeiensis]|uniref:tetratricopeptide repeat protein n=1 Tax=Lapidilactobacillus luobeiensis TaxID=2950371 RepID=UPI0021C32F46|nr:tetratricopeptide repeat protein [Lapidilactobacillus luobeiensis]